jgi:hypothetical protein
MRTLLIDDIRKIKADVTARTFQEGIDALKKEKFDILYLDHDLGDPDPKHTGYDIMNFLEEHQEHLPSKIIIVSSNPVGVLKINSVIKRLYGG